MDEPADEHPAQPEELRRLWQLARRTGDTIPPDELRRVAALAFRATGCRPPLEPLARLCPDVVAIAAQETLALFRR